MLSSFVVALREGVEAALIISIILSYLARTGNRQHFPKIGLGVVLAIVASAVSGLVLFTVLKNSSDDLEPIIAGTATLVAVGVLTFMVFWMKKLARNMKQELQVRVDQALASGSALAFATLAFVSIIREGVEVVLFMMAEGGNTSPLQATFGTLLGLLVALVLGYLIYKGSSRVNLRRFFDWTGTFLIIIAAGLLAAAFRDLHELHWVPRVLTMWDTSSILSEDGLVGGLAKSLFGYDASPSLVQVVAYLGYLVTGFLVYFNPFRINAPATEKA